MTKDQLHIGNWNMLQGRGANDAARRAWAIMAHHGLDALALQETSAAYDAALKRTRPPGARIVDGGSSAVLVAPDVPMSHWERPTMTTRGWITTKGARTAPKDAASVIVGGWLRVTSVHLPPSTWRGNRFGGPIRRKLAYRQHMVYAVRYARKRRRDHLFIGDWNSTPKARGWYSPRWLAKKIGGRIVAPTKGTHGSRVIGFGFLRGTTGTSTPQVHDRNGSDHRLVTFTITRQGS